ncbi:MAG: hypothetical protein F4187_05505 [Gemmatimonadetes bacterium]|nr:hypothetical protein [Gemmatimonadota bacterium]
MSAISEVLRQLDEWRHLPAYQLERRVDIFFGMFLPKVIERTFDIRVDEVIPEFPLHKGMLNISEAREDNQSVNVDFAVVGHQGKKKRVLLIELKTDIGSLNPDQLENMEKARRADSKDLLQGVIFAAWNSKSKHKYAHLIWRLVKQGCLQSCGREITDIELENCGQKELREVYEDLSVGPKWRYVEVDIVVVRECQKFCV